MTDKSDLKILWRWVFVGMISYTHPEKVERLGMSQ